jgi:O-antigen/teichoic acid export membrane protein
MPLFKELLSYTGWNLFGASAGVLKYQAINILLNQFFSPIMIASRGIALQVNTAVNSFAQSFSTAVRPQIIKSYATHDIKKMTALVFRSCKGTFILMYMFTLPLCIETPYVLKLWLKTPPEYAILFTRLTLIDVLIDSISYPLMAAAQASGKIRLYQGVLGGISLLNLPISLFSLWIGFPPEAVFYTAICLTGVSFLARLGILGKLITFPVRKFIIKVAFPISISAVLALILPSSIQRIMPENLFRFFCIFFLSISCTGFMAYFIALSKEERYWLNDTILQRGCKTI